LLQMAGADIGKCYTPDDAIAAEDVSVSLFRRSEESSGVKVKQLEIDPEWGIPEDEFVQVAEELSDDSAALLEQLEDAS